MNISAASALVTMGDIDGAFGVRGWIKVRPQTEAIDSLFEYPVWWIGKNQQWQQYRVIEGQLAARYIVVQLDGIENRDQASVLRGLHVAVMRSQLPQTQDNEYYWTDLIGLAVVNHEGVLLGQVINLFETGANDVLVVEQGQQRRLIPFVAAVVTTVDCQAGRMVVDWGADY